MYTSDSGLSGQLVLRVCRGSMRSHSSPQAAYRIRLSHQRMTPTIRDSTRIAAATVPTIDAMARPQAWSGLSGGPTVVTNNAHPEARRRVERIREQTGVELTVEEILDSPHTFIGSVTDLTRKFVDLRERFGISSFLIDDLDALAPVVEELAGH
jgi:hypothetical protein